LLLEYNATAAIGGDHLGRTTDDRAVNGSSAIYLSAGRGQRQPLFARGERRRATRREQGYELCCCCVYENPGGGWLCHSEGSPRSPLGEEGSAGE
jgi:hypothetical protein